MPEPTTPFHRFIAELMAYHRTAAAVACTTHTNAYIRDQVYIYQAQAEAGTYYDQAAHIQAAKNAVVAGIVALCTMYVGGLIMSRFAAVAAGEAGAAAGAATPGILEVKGVTLISTVGVAAPGLTIPETLIVEGLFGTWVRAALAGVGAVITDAYRGQARWSDWAKIMVTSVGGMHRLGPAPAFFLGYLESQSAQELRDAFEAEIAKPELKAVMKAIDKQVSARLTSEVKAKGRFAPLIWVPRGVLDQKVRQPMQRAVDKITDQIVAKETGMFGGPKRGDVYAKVYAKFGANVIAPIASDISAARIMLEMQAQQQSKRLDKAFLDWKASLGK